MTKKAIFAVILLFVITIAFTNGLYSQLFTNPRLSFGVVTTNILGDNRAKLPMVATDDEENAYTGGSFGFTQPGLRFLATFPETTNDDLRFNASIDYLFFSGRERIVINRNIVHLLRHDVNLLGFGAGADYVLLDLGFANAKFVAGAEIKGYYLHGISAEIYEDYLNENSNDNVYKHTPKSSSFRLGGSVKFGVEGRLRKNIFVNAGVGLGAINLLGRDDARGELLTPLTLFENSEALVSTFNVYILLQYNL